VKLPPSVKKTVQDVRSILEPTHPKLAKMFAACFPNTLETTTEVLSDGTSYIFTGDIPAMWLRDSSAQVRPYLPLAKQDPAVGSIIEGLLKRQMMYIDIDPYANAFNREPNGRCWHRDDTRMNDWVWERKYEVDSLCYPLQLAYLYWQATGRTSIFDAPFKHILKRILDLWRREQRHLELSPYRFVRGRKGHEGTVLYNDGLGRPVNDTGMTWSGFRPSDDPCRYGYLIPSNAFAVVVLWHMEEVAQRVYGDRRLAASAAQLAREIDEGIQTYGIVEHPRYGAIYAYETDGFGNYNLMDDANVPSLLSLPYLGYTTIDDPIYQNTRRFVLSEDNPHYAEGKYARGIGSPHTPAGYVWPMSLVMQALTSQDEEEIEELLSILTQTDAGTGFMHESFDPDDPHSFTREWFAWANSLFGQLVSSWCGKRVRTGRVSFSVEEYDSLVERTLEVELVS
jgi:hypothetical protein